ncbi:hypothetical protein TcWFU_008584 [Taenia crassiceps]|uniref:Uncharacterized protein n=1 Tax=Taenia crassiceps TaxID=6207 RepID=A0ABR4Q0E8_9CEST
MKFGAMECEVIEVKKGSEVDGNATEWACGPVTSLPTNLNRSTHLRMAITSVGLRHTDAYPILTFLHSHPLLGHSSYSSHISSTGWKAQHSTTASVHFEMLMTPKWETGFGVSLNPMLCALTAPDAVQRQGCS